MWILCSWTRRICIFSRSKAIYVGGYFSGGSWSASPANSPLIDQGDPGSDVALELPPNGGRINIGAYGNTPVASKSFSVAYPGVLIQML